VLVIAVDTRTASDAQLTWAARRHDDDGTESTGEPTPQGLFDAVFHALHDGEQVAIGWDCPLTAPAEDGDRVDPEAALARARALTAGAGLDALGRLVSELGEWRPWTIVTTSSARWRATTSVLLWEFAGDAEPERAIDAFYAALHTDDAGEDEPALNLAAAIAVGSGATADPDELLRRGLSLSG